MALIFFNVHVTEPLNEPPLKQQNVWPKYAYREKV